MEFININYQKEFLHCRLEDLLALQGELLSKDSISDVIRTNLNNSNVIIKRYYKPSKNTFRSLAKYSNLVSQFVSKGSREFRNLLFFANNGFFTPEIIYFSQAKGQSCLVTKELLNSQDLSQFFKNHSINTQNFTYLLEFISIIKSLHDKGFIHRDFKLRNVILSEEKTLYLIDCPAGFIDYFSLFCGPFYHKVSIFLKQRDLANIYKDLTKVLLTPRQLLKLYKHYYGLKNGKLALEDKQNIHKIISYYKYR